MESVLCRICLQVSQAQVIALNHTMALPKAPSVREALSGCVPEMNLEAFAQSVICSSCLVELTAAYEFKAKCIKTEEIVTKFLNNKPDDGKNVDLYGCVLKSELLKPKDEPVEIVDNSGEAKSSPELVEVKVETEVDPLRISPPRSPPPNSRKATKEPLFKCKRCSSSCTTKSDLTTHYRSEHGREPPKKVSRLTCTVCKFKAKSVIDLQQHKNTTHGSKNSYTCDQCDFQTARLNSLALHVRTHTGEKPYKCSHCDYRASMSSAMSSHMRTHTGEKRYVCDRCGFQATALSTLRVHIRRHTGAKPYKCNECSFAAINSGHLKDHMRTSHSGERPFSCEYCGYSAKMRKHLKEHVRRHESKL